MGHAILSPSGASRWLECTPSARLEQQFPDRAGDAAREGTLAHSIAENLLQRKLGLINDLQWKDKLRTHQAHKLYHNDMLGYVEEYTANIIEKFNAAGNGAEIFLESKLDLTAWVPDGFGTGDVVIIGNGVLYIDDLKYGKGVPVSAEENKQMMLYALGALHLYLMIFEPVKIVMTIHQPRLDSVSSWEILTEDLLAWAEAELKPKAALAFDGSGEYKAGKHCRFCKAAAMCKANADFNLETVAHDFMSADLLKDETVVEILSRADLFTKWIKTVAEHALETAVKGKKWPGMKLVEGRSVRKIRDEEAALAALREAGFKDAEILHPEELLGITALTGNLGAAKFNELVGPLLVKPTGKPALVPENDKRPELNNLEKAAEAFADVETD